MEMDQSRVWIVGLGPMGIAYAKALRALGHDVLGVGRGAQGVAAFREATGFEAVAGGLEAALAAHAPPARAIVATPIMVLASSALTLISAGTRDLLVEKPAGVDLEDFRRLARGAEESGARVWLAYNRRFLPSVQEARRMIAEDGGAVAFSFEFSDPGDRIAASAHPPEVKRNWLYANGTHVIDLAFHLGGEPELLSAYVEGSLDWHPAAASFSGAGRSFGGALFSYQANYEAPGRWGVVVDTRQRRLSLRPLEELHVQKRGSFALEKADLAIPPEEADLKPGLPGQLRAFLQGEGREHLLDAAAHLERAEQVYARILAGSAGHGSRNDVEKQS
ncbi:Gfo/Idh/MocA family oxidoreductase [Neomegalonema sp.]|uniref:Gfo/Idh/MocA family oxidoreductase n=1 Tax=Neomegalonema sp. TaxID=2039713 RepID=UPI00261A504D|nr:Gfo/Idh/MocA family oxidoreductase [Neomegalonema sp.]MDD2870023.1 Gfo/Idh/MocA family oxidoreductase [Neomegalonema sp.]